MESLRALLYKITRNIFEENSQHWVYVTHINDPHNFYVRLLDYDSYIPVLEARGESFFLSEIHNQLDVVYASKTVRAYVRGQICSINSGQTFDVFAIDYGCVDKNVPVPLIYKPFYNHETPPLAHLCSLSTCMPVQGLDWSEDSINAMKSYVKKERAKLLVRRTTPNKMEVELTNTCPDEIGILLIKTGHASFAMTHQDISRVNVPTQSRFIYKIKELVISDVLHVRHLRGKTANEFFVSQIDDYRDHILKRRGDLDSFIGYQRSLDMNEAKVGLPVAVKSNIDYKYERSIITKVFQHKETAEVFLVDCGITITTHISLIKPLDREMFFQTPPIAIYCHVDTNQCTKNLLNYLLPGYEFNINIKSIGDTYKTPYTVEITSLLR